MRKTMVRLLSAVLVLSSLCAVNGRAVELRGYDKTQKKAEQYQYVQLGEYPYEKDGTPRPVKWLVLGVEDGQALLFSEYIIEAHQVISCGNYNEAYKTHKFRRITDFADSDLCEFMNTEMLDTLLGADPIRDALVETHYGKMYPLTAEQIMTTKYGFKADRYWDHPERRCKATPYAKNKVQWPGRFRKLSVDSKTECTPYWVVAFKYPDKPQEYFFQLCGGNGHLSYGAYTRTDVGTRPAITLDLSKCEIAAGSGTIQDPFVMHYTGPAAAGVVEDQAP